MEEIILTILEEWNVTKRVEAMPDYGQFHYKEFQKNLSKEIAERIRAVSNNKFEPTRE